MAAEEYDRTRDGSATGGGPDNQALPTLIRYFDPKQPCPVVYDAQGLYRRLLHFCRSRGYA
jgi:hypothetical protein